MGPEAMLGMLREGILLILMMIAPIVGSGLLVGLTVSILQATTQIQEPTLAFVPKIVTVLLVLMLLGGWIINLITRFTLQLWEKGLILF
ncbi:MAG: flagellar biosynthesis protein FliQ [Firmicutes bacterium]|nr:flagellar biosynthesis protein FliQ [Bacillota bacterium]